MALERGSADTVFIGDVTFVPVGNIYYDYTAAPIYSLYIQHKGAVELPGQNSAFGVRTQTAGSNNAILSDKTIFYNLKLPVNYTLSVDNKYFFKSGDKFVRFSNIKQMTAFFPAYADKIKTFAKSNDLSFDRPNDVKKLVIYCNALK